jgi:hypothetical protein
METLTPRELRLVRYALAFLKTELDTDLSVEAAQEMAPETQASGEPLPDVATAIDATRGKVERLLGSA